MRPKPAATVLSGLRVLVIDNEPAILEGMRLLLSGWGCDTWTASDLESAHQALRTHKALPEVIIADYHLDETDGLEVIKALRWKIAKQEGTPAYIIFTNASLEDMARKAPTTLEDFRKVSGVGNAKVQRYGETFVDAIAEYLLEHGRG